MAVMGPTYSTQVVDEIFDRVMLLLKEYGIQKRPVAKNSFADWNQDRMKRNYMLWKAIEGLVELDSWENF